LLGGILLLVVVAIFVLSMLAESLAQYIPFNAERQLVSIHQVSQQEETPINRYLQQVADKVAASQSLPDGMTITVHYVDEDTVNAFATLGGHIFLYRGLLEKLPHENALTMLIGHEVAHIKHRHPIRGMGRAVVIGIAIGMINGSVGNEVVGQVLGETGFMTALKFNRDQELEADREALAAVEEIYGHVNGTSDLFKILQQSAPEGGGELEIFSTHPMVSERINRINGGVEGEKLPLPAGFADWLIADQRGAR